MKSRCYFIGGGWGDGALAHHFRALANELAGRGHRVVMLLHGTKRDNDVEVLEGNPLVLSWPSKRPTKLRDAVFLYGLIRQYRPDCMISSFGAANLMIIVGKLLRVPCRVDWYQTLTAQIDIDWRQPRWKLKLLQVRKRIVYKAVTYIIPVSQAARDDAERVYGIPKSKCQIFYNSLADPNEAFVLSETNRLNDKLICVGRLNTSKGQDILIKVIAVLKHTLPGLQVEFIGSGIAKDGYAQLAADLGISDKCVFAGSATRAQILSEMKSAAATVVPSRSDNCPLVVIESLAVGTPVIASGVGGIVEMLRDRVHGLVFSPDDPRALAEALSEFATNTDLREAMSRNARQHFLETFELGRSVREQANWFEGVVARRSPAH
jgi:glycosyltransferase involved in cell wall biosynthesis